MRARNGMQKEVNNFVELGFNGSPLVSLVLPGLPLTHLNGRPCLQNGRIGVLESQNHVTHAHDLLLLLLENVEIPC